MSFIQHLMSVWGWNVALRKTQSRLFWWWIMTGNRNIRTWSFSFKEEGPVSIVRYANLQTLISNKEDITPKYFLQLLPICVLNFNMFFCFQIDREVCGSQKTIAHGQQELDQSKGIYLYLWRKWNSFHSCISFSLHHHVGMNTSWLQFCISREDAVCILLSWS